MADFIVYTALVQKDSNPKRFYSLMLYTYQYLKPYLRQSTMYGAQTFKSTKYIIHVKRKKIINIIIPSFSLYLGTLDHKITFPFLYKFQAMQQLLHIEG